MSLITLGSSGHTFGLNKPGKGNKGQGCLKAGHQLNGTWEVGAVGSCFLLSPERVGPGVRGARVGRWSQAEGTSVCNAVLAFQVQWPDGPASSDAFWGARMLLELSGGSLG